ncbi:MAG TPA: gephyrin-like molybdotransferase Glp [Terracidiphilus sp.]|nr:gephyrin-like molybdotransferase Glp [Terracidiphilus sp.]
MSPELLSYEEAARLVAAHAAQLTPCGRIESVALSRARGRVLARPLVADLDQPPFPRATRDGFACRAEEASRHQPLAIAGASRAGDPPSGPLPPGAAWEIMTGAPVPAGADAVMMIEHVETAGHSRTATVRLLPPRTIAAGENVVEQGAQARAGQELLAPGAVIEAGQIALAAACGYAELCVFARPRVAILATGDELVPVEAKPGPGQIRNSNGPMLAAMVEAAGGDPWLLPAAADSAGALDAAIAEARTADLVLITGGVSAGKFDLVEPALARAGATLHFTGVKIQPGKPAVFGEFPADSPDQKKNGAKCFGLPGNPVSSAVTFLLFVAPVLAALAGRRDGGPRFALARLGAAVAHRPGLTRFLPAASSFGSANEPPEVSLIPWQGSGDLTALARANCFLVVPEGLERLEAGAAVRILLP